jgi:hypothetical protein
MKNTFVQVMLATLVILVLGFFVAWLTTEKPAPVTDYPWTIETTADGSIKVFNTHLGVSTLGAFIQHYKTEPEISLFSPPAGEAVIEAYFNSLWIGGVKARVVLSLAVNKPDLDAMYDRGLRISTLGSGTRKVQLSGDDLMHLNDVAITAITYIPSLNLEASMLEKRFGEPAQKIIDQKNSAEHWLYPAKGLDIALNENEKDVMQYVSPRDFEKITAPLQATKFLQQSKAVVPANAGTH